MILAAGTLVRREWKWYEQDGVGSIVSVSGTGKEGVATAKFP